MCLLPLDDITLRARGDCYHKTPSCLFITAELRLKPREQRLVVVAVVVVGVECSYTLPNQVYYCTYLV